MQVADYLLLAEAGAFGDARTELIEGEVMISGPQFRPAGMVKMGLYTALDARLTAICSALVPVIDFSVDLLPDSMPDPDIMLTDEPDGARAVPARSVALVIEVADFSLREDLGRKRLLYAVGGIPEYWVADVNGRVIHRFWEPVDGDYGRANETAFGLPETVPELTISTADL